MIGPQQALLFGAAAVAGAVNSVAGGGTLLTFPALIAAGQTSKLANATSTVSLWPGQVSSLWGYRSEIGQTRAVVIPMLLIGLVGGGLGAFLLLETPTKTFDRIVPFLILAATLLFMVQEPISRWLRSRAATGGSIPQASAAKDASALPENTPETLPRMTLPVTLLVFVTAIYGGYFGAGMGIVTLAALSFLGFRNIHQMNGVKNIFTLGINGVAAMIFVSKGLVDWRVCGLMAVGAIFGGYSGAGIARRIGQRNVRRVIIGIGFILTLSLLRR